jgi:hypothetical protein
MYMSERVFSEAKYWLSPVSLSKCRGFRDHELTEIRKIVEEHQEEILRVWQQEERKRGHSES